MDHTVGVELRVLGAIEVTVDGRPQSLGPTQRRLLAVLLANHGRVVSTEALSDALWGDSPPPTARATLQTHLSRLRGLLREGTGPVVVSRPPGYALDPGSVELDAEQFEASVEDARRLLPADPRGAAVRLAEGLSWWRGRAFDEFADVSWARPEAVRLEELRLVALELLHDARSAAGEASDLVGELEALVVEHPLRERFWTQLMVALHRSGRQGEALRAGQTLRHLLREELGLDPSADFCVVEQAVASGEIVDAEGGGGSLSPGTGSRRDLSKAPAWMAPSLVEIVGRSSDLDDLVEVMASVRVLTLTGPGGVGKSTLAAELARRVASRFPGGVAMVELATVQDAGAVLSAVAHVLDVERRAERSLAESIVEVLGTRRMLLVLDNCEHVLEALGDLVGRILRWCPDVRLVATSREPLGVVGETVRTVAPLVVPNGVDDPLDVLSAVPAVQVFVARAQEAAPSFELTARSAPAVAQVCIQLDGLPLALELAAARMAAVSPRQLADRLHERFVLLGGTSGRDPRHRTLLDMVEWSHELLTPKEQALLARLSVFAGGFDLETAEQVCGGGELDPVEVVHLLANLVDKSLVVADRVDERVRYRQLETLRQFGADRLHEQAGADEVRDAHARTFVALAEQGGHGLHGPEEGAWAERLERDLGNLRVAVRHAITTGAGDEALRLVCALRELAFRRIRYEIIAWTEDVVAMEGVEDHPLFPTAVAVVGYGHFVRGELEAAIGTAGRAIEIGARLGVESSGLPERTLGNAEFYRGDHPAALGWIDRMTALARVAGDEPRLAHALYMGSVARTSVRDADRGRGLAAEARELAHRIGCPTAIAQAEYAHGLTLSGSDVEAAIERLDEAAAVAGSVGNRWLNAFALTEGHWLRARQGDTSVALRGYRGVIETWFQGGDWANQWLSLRHLAGIVAELGRDEEAALLFAAVAAAGAAHALPFPPDDADRLDLIAHEVAERLGPAAMADAARRAGQMRDDATVASALRIIDELS